MSDLYAITEAAMLLLGLASLLTWVYVDSSARDGISTFSWTMSALFLPAAIFYAVIVRTRHPRTEPPTKLEHSAFSLAFGILAWTILETYYPTIFPRSTSGVAAAIASVSLFALVSYAVVSVSGS